MKIHDPRSVTEHCLVTVSGRQVYNFGRKHTLEFAPHRLKSSTTDPVDSPFNAARLVRAMADVGEPCQWVFNRKTEAMDVTF